MQMSSKKLIKNILHNLYGVSLFHGTNKLLSAPNPPYLKIEEGHYHIQ